MTNCLIAMDVGGTTIHAAVVRDNKIIERTIKTYDARANKNKDNIISNLMFIIKDQLFIVKKELKNEGCSNFTLSGVVMGFPGPFDYENGISYIIKLNKFDAIYGVNIKEELMKLIEYDSRVRNYFGETICIAFGNDATLFAFGEGFFGQGKMYSRYMCLTLGTGCGSAFINNGKQVRGEYGVPKTGEIFNEPFEYGIIDDYFSTRGLLNLALGKKINVSNVHELAILAKSDIKSQAQEVFNLFGEKLGKILSKYVHTFQPDVIIFGGGISKSFELFRETLEKEIDPIKTPVKVSVRPLYSTFIGATQLL
ncbi:hypothetical protein CR203_23025 [Salipaludibacillus neizhouensis]|uniref:Glucokinase n=1 Tax=Salipaludibacillus neizhouensis TaxID=885475 RepID=A0A3A9K179_9BACI|nr:ROK family protein [Salipaludibacillus neizhouensis]RKL65008.1 hypothetical protein CR203_23025 [Salipaludibacillus neizhouensis]